MFTSGDALSLPPQLISDSLGVMKAWAIPNSLLRVDRLAASPPPEPFECPTQAGDFAVLELGSHSDAEGWATHVTDALRTHGAAIRELQRAGASVVLFVESEQATPFLFHARLLRALADAEVALEHYAHVNA